MKIYKISQRQNNDYDTYDSAVVIAENEDQARNINPDKDNDLFIKDWSNMCWTWCNGPKHVTVEYIGEAKEGSEVGIVCASFNAG